MRTAGTALAAALVLPATLAVPASAPAERPAPAAVTRPAPEPEPEPAPAPAPQPELVAPVVFGAATPDLAALGRLEQAVGARVGSYTYYRSWAHAADFDAGFASTVRARGAVPSLTWEPWDPARGTRQPAYALRRISSGAYDAYVTRWARQIKAWGGPLQLRFAHEMNGTWYPWAEAVNGNRPGDYVAAWRHVRGIFRSVGVDNVTWVWSPNVEYAGSTPLARLFPGDAAVDRVGVDGYNAGTALPDRTWTSFPQLFGPTLQRVRALSRRPLLISEVGSAEQGGSKAAWIRTFLSTVAGTRDVVGFTWFNYDKEADWRVQSSPSARQAFADGLTAPRFTG